MNIFLDIETIPCQTPGFVDQLAREVTAPSTYKKAESIEAWLAENRMAVALEQHLKTSFDGGLGQIVCISWATEEGDTSALQVTDLSPQAERAMLEVFIDDINALRAKHNMRMPRWVGHNVAGFDLPFLWKRCVVLRERAPSWLPAHPKPWGEQVYDTMVEWAGPKGTVSLDRLCKMLGIPGKGGFSGSDVWPAVQTDRLDEVTEYCREDVKRVRWIYRRMTFSEAA